jgi:hypothetical protein
MPDGEITEAELTEALLSSQSRPAGASRKHGARPNPANFSVSPRTGRRSQSQDHQRARTTDHP